MRRVRSAPTSRKKSEDCCTVFISEKLGFHQTNPEGTKLCLFVLNGGTHLSLSAFQIEKLQSSWSGAEQSRPDRSNVVRIRNVASNSSRNILNCMRFRSFF